MQKINKFAFTAAAAGKLAHWKGKLEIRYVEKDATSSSESDSLAPLVIITNNKKHKKNSHKKSSRDSSKQVSPMSPLSDDLSPLNSVESPISPASEHGSGKRRRIYSRNQILRVRKTMNRNE